MEGYCYQLGTTCADIDTLCADTLYEDGIIDSDDKAEDMETLTKAQELAERFETDGLIVTRLPDDDGEDCGWEIKTPAKDDLDNFKKCWLQPKYDMFKHLADSITLDQFIQFQNQAVMMAKELLADTEHDWVQFENDIGVAYMPMDTFIRQPQPDTAYYLSETTVRVN